MGISSRNSESFPLLISCKNVRDFPFENIFIISKLWYALIDHN